MDMEAGLEPSRGTTRGMDWLLVVVEPTRQSMETARHPITGPRYRFDTHRCGRTAKSRDEQEQQFLLQAIAPLPLLGVIPYDDAIRRAEMEGRPPEAANPAVQQAIHAIMRQLTEESGVRQPA